MKVLVACEYSGVVRRAFRALGHDAWSCDLLPAADGSEFHIQGDVINHLHGRTVMLPFGVHYEKWDLMIAHPPCTYLSNMSNCRIKEPGRIELREKAFDFFMSLVNAPIPKIAVENPRGYPERQYQKASQIIQPYFFGHPQSKATCLWLKNLPPLAPAQIVEPKRRWDGKRWRTWVDSLPSSSPKRSITFPGIAAAMAEQWGQENYQLQATKGSDNG